MFSRDILIRNIEAGSLLETFFISAVSSLLLVRFYLFIARYPQLGSGGLHIAHMLWGGLLMFVALVILLTFLSRNAVRIAAIFGGLGFGVFIDELGKFITSDNNYFFQPTVALIYVIFVFIYLLIRLIPNYQDHTEKEYLINALDMVKEAVINDLDTEEEKLALQYLKHSNQKDPIVQSLIQLLNKIEAVEPRHPGMIAQVRKFARNMYTKMASKEIFAKIIVFILILESLTAISGMSYILLTKLTLSIDEWGVFITAMIASFFVFIGTFYLYRSKLDAYKHFKTSVLILIFLTQFFLFYSAQFQALIALVCNLIVFIIVEYVLTLEKEKLRTHTNAQLAEENL